jgi:hypothetical protein
MKLIYKDKGLLVDNFALSKMPLYFQRHLNQSSKLYANFLNPWSVTYYLNGPFLSPKTEKNVICSQVKGAK